MYVCCFEYFHQNDVKFRDAHARVYAVINDPVPSSAEGAVELCCGLSVVRVNVYEACLRETLCLQNESDC